MFLSFPLPLLRKKKKQRGLIEQLQVELAAYLEVNEPDVPDVLRPGVSFILIRASRGKLAYDGYLTLGEDATLLNVPEDYTIRLVYKGKQPDAEMPQACCESIAPLLLNKAVRQKVKVAYTEGISWKNVRGRRVGGRRRRRRRR